MKLTYKAATKSGKILQGILDAKDTKEAAYFLRKKDLTPIHIKAQSTQTLESFLPFLKKHTSKDLILFTRQLSSMIASGLTLTQALHILDNQMQKSSMQEVVEKIIADIEEGKTLSQAISKYPDIFSPIYISLVQAGESAGFLENILKRLADNLEKQQDLQNTIRSALLYPVIIVILMIVVISLMMILVIPQLTTLYTGLNLSLPISTQIIIAISNTMVTLWPLLILMVLGCAYGYRRWNKTATGKKFIDKIKLRIPLFGKVIQQSIIAEFSRTFGLLMSSGALVTTSLHQTAQVTGNTVYTNAILEISASVEKGITIGNAMESYPLFPPMLVQMVKLGEQTGKLDESLLKVSEYFQREVELTVKNLTTLIEPIIMVVLGLGVAFVVLSIITPIYQITSSIK
ncbi:MAG TPA: type II secretion system F family protein [Candidatus Saccharimonadales bacterium]|nr:type II secretion system F family protein [Candidatus Saccharimonadales bacterium]